MGAKERAKGRAGEAEAAAIFREHGHTVRGLEGQGDHLIVCTRDTGNRETLTLHSEVKRQETARVWAWLQQAELEAPPGTVPAVTFRRNRSPWYTIVKTDTLARLLS